jgi:hypothetical protein
LFFVRLLKEPPFLSESTDFDLVVSLLELSLIPDFGNQNPRWETDYSSNLFQHGHKTGVIRGIQY